MKHHDIMKYNMSCLMEVSDLRQYLQDSGGTTCLTLLVQRMFSPSGANVFANDGGP